MYRVEMIKKEIIDLEFVALNDTSKSLNDNKHLRILELCFNNGYRVNIPFSVKEMRSRKVIDMLRECANLIEDNCKGVE